MGCRVICDKGTQLPNLQLVLIVSALAATNFQLGAVRFALGLQPASVKCLTFPTSLAKLIPHPITHSHIFAYANFSSYLLRNYATGCRRAHAANKIRNKLRDAWVMRQPTDCHNLCCGKPPVASVSWPVLPFQRRGTADPDTDTDSGCLYCLFNMCTVAWITSSSNSRNISGSNGNKGFSLSYAAHLKRQQSAIVAFAAITMSSLLLLYRLFRPIFRPPPTLSFSTPIMSENLK